MGGIGVRSGLRLAGALMAMVLLSGCVVEPYHYRAPRYTAYHPHPSGNPAMAY